MQIVCQPGQTTGPSLRATQNLFQNCTHMCPKLQDLALREPPLWFGDEMALPSASHAGSLQIGKHLLFFFTSVFEMKILQYKFVRKANNHS